MRRAGVSKPCVWRWQERFMREGVVGLLRDKTRKPGLPPLPSTLIDRVVALTLAERPGEATHWTGRAMGAASGISLRSVQRIWAAHGLQPHRVRRFKLSQDPAFAAKLRDVVGLYLDPPAHSLVLSVDEKSQIQALDRTQPGLPMKRGRAGTMTHDYIHNGTTTLFAALNVLDGTVIGQCMERHCHQEFLRFLNRIEAAVPAGKLIHAILDNYARPQASQGARLARPTSALDLPLRPDFVLLGQCGGRLFRRARLQRGVFHSLVDLQVAINRYLAETECYWIDADGEDDRDGRSGRLGRECRGDGGRKNHGYAARDEIGRQRRQSIVFAAGPTILDRDVLALDKAGLAQPLAEGGQAAGKPLRSRIEISDQRHRLLRARVARHCNRSTAKEGQEFAASHSITSSARARIEGGMVSPSAFAVFRLITISNFVGCSIGRSPGFAPLRILST